MDFILSGYVDIILSRPVFGGEQLAKQRVPRLLISFLNSHCDVPMAGHATVSTASSLSGARSLSAMLTAVTRLSGREGIRMHIPNKPSQAAHIARRPSFFTVLLAAGVADRDRSTLRLLNPVIVRATLPLPSPNTSHTTPACSPALTSLRRRLLLLLLRRRYGQLLLGGGGGTGGRDGGEGGERGGG